MADHWLPAGTVDVQRDELIALFIARRLAPGLRDTNLGRSLDSLWGKLSTPGRQTNLAFGDEGWLQVPAPAAIDYGPHRITLDTIRDAIRARCALEIHYRKSDGSESQRVIEPALVRWDPAVETLYVVAWCRQRDEQRDLRRSPHPRRATHRRTLRAAPRRRRGDEQGVSAVDATEHRARCRAILTRGCRRDSRAPMASEPTHRRHRRRRPRSRDGRGGPRGARALAARLRRRRRRGSTGTPRDADPRAPCRRRGSCASGRAAGRSSPPTPAHRHATGQSPPSIIASEPAG